MAEESIRDRICYHNREVRALGDYVDLGWLASRGNENTATSSERGGEEKPAARRGRATLAHALPSRYPSPAKLSYHCNPVRLPAEARTGAFL
jgi:hypothetical protein